MSKPPAIFKIVVEANAATSALPRRLGPRGEVPASGMTITPDGAVVRAYTINQAAELKGLSPDYIRKAIHATEGPFVEAKMVGRRYIISATALEAWWEMLPNA